MPLKKDKKIVKPVKKSGKEKISVIIDGIPVSDMTKEQLEGHVTRLHDELDKEREERNFYQLERDKMQTFWDVTKLQLDKTRAELKNIQREIEEVEEKHLAEIKLYKQKVKHLIHEHQCKLTEEKTKSLVTLKEAEQDYERKEKLFNEETRNLKKQMRDEDKTYQQKLHGLELKHAEEGAKLRIDLQKEITQMESKSNLKLQTTINDFEQKARTELMQMEEKKNQQMNLLIKNHEKAFSDIKNYYNDITVNNLALITTLKEQIESVKNKEERLQKKTKELLLENRRLVEPLEKAQHDVMLLEKQITKYEREKVLLRSSTARLKLATEEIKELKWEIEVLQQKFQQLQSERDDLHSRFVFAIQEVQQKSSLKTVLLENKLQTLEGILEDKDVKLQEVLTSCNMDANAVNATSKTTEEILHSKDFTINKLQTELANLKKATGQELTHLNG